MKNLTFTKMHGLGNDFAIFDIRESNINISSEEASAIADRRRGIGCDQVLLLNYSENHDAEMIVYNSDGSKAETCGNGLRCVVSYLSKLLKRKKINILSGKVNTLGKMLDDGRVQVNVGAPDLEWNKIPLAYKIDTLHLELSRELNGKVCLSDPVAVSMGNPHAVFFVEKIEDIDLETLGPGLENDPLFPNKANISIVSIVKRNLIQVRVWERGVGLTEACGSAACASLVAGVRRGLCDKESTVILPGGELNISWLEDKSVNVVGSASFVYEGKYNFTKER